MHLWQNRGKSGRMASDANYLPEKSVGVKVGDEQPLMEILCQRGRDACGASNAIVALLDVGWDDPMCDGHDRIERSEDQPRLFHSEMIQRSKPGRLCAVV